MPQINNHKQTRILILRVGALGDTVCATSIIEPLRHHYGNNTIIDWVAKAQVGKLDNCQTKQCMYNVKPHDVLDALNI